MRILNNFFILFLMTSLGCANPRLDSFWMQLNEKIDDCIVGEMSEDAFIAWYKSNIWHFLTLEQRRIHSIGFPTILFDSAACKVSSLAHVKEWREVLISSWREEYRDLVDYYYNESDIKNLKDAINKKCILFTYLVDIQPMSNLRPGYSTIVDSPIAWKTLAWMAIYGDDILLYRPYPIFKWHELLFIKYQKPLIQKPLNLDRSKKINADLKSKLHYNKNYQYRDIQILIPEDL